MATLYGGLAYPPPGQDSPGPAPGPGVSPGVGIPADTDANNVSTMLLNQDRTFADHLANIQSTAFISSPSTYNTALSSAGFSAVVRTGTGTGTIAPSGQGISGLNVVIKIIVGGAVGVTTYQYSTDGGTTYSATTPATTTTLGSTGITLAFSGTFVAADLYQFKQAFTPAARIVDVSSKARFIVDHNGIDTGGRMTRIEESYRITSSAATADPLANYAHMRFSRTGTTFNYSTQLFTGMPTLQINTGANTSGDKGYVRQDAAVFNPTFLSTTSIVVAEWEVYLSGTGTTNVGVWSGFAGSAFADTATDGLMFYSPPAGGTWFAYSVGGGSNTSNSTAAVPTGATWTRLKLEFHRSGAPFASATGSPVALFFVNDVFVSAIATNLPAADLYPIFGCTTAAGALSVGTYFSPYSIRLLRGPDSKV